MINELSEAQVRSFELIELEINGIEGKTAIAFTNDGNLKFPSLTNLGR